MPRPGRRRPPPPSPFAAAGCALVICAALLFARAFWLSLGLLWAYLRALWIGHGAWVAVPLVIGGAGLMVLSHSIQRRGRGPDA